jgi:hypothetical protein
MALETLAPTVTGLQTTSIPSNLSTYFPYKILLKVLTAFISSSLVGAGESYFVGVAALVSIPNSLAKASAALSAGVVGFSGFY